MLYWHDIKMFYILPKLSILHENFNTKITLKKPTQDVTTSIYASAKSHYRNII